MTRTVVVVAPEQLSAATATIFYDINWTKTTTTTTTTLNSSSVNTSRFASSPLTINAIVRNDDLKLFYRNIESKLSILPFVFMLAGTLGNMLAFYVLTRKKLRSQSTMLYFATLTIMDTISLYQWYFQKNYV
jgi:hypothetical protein